MYLKELRLVQKDGVIIRKVKFHLGANFVVDEEKSTRHNHVGKTTFLKLIDIALGSQDKKFLYEDAQTNTKNTKLKKLINEKQISIELDLCSDFEKMKNRDNTNLKVDLFKRGHKYINNKQENAKEYNAELNKILFNNYKNIPTFRQLIPFFVRVSARKDNYNFLKNLFPATKKTTYREVYNYLFDVPGSSNLQDLEKNKDQLDQIKSAEKHYKRIGNNDQQTDVLIQKINVNRAQQQYLKLKLDDIVKGTNFVKNRDKITHARNQYVEMKNKFEELKYRKKLIDIDIRDVNSQNLQVNNDLTKDFFDEIKKALPKVDKTYNELIAFNIALKENKLDYLKQLRDAINKKITFLHNKIDKFLDKNENIIGLVKNNNIAKYDEMNKDLTTVNQNIAQQEEILNTLRRFTVEEDELNNKINTLQNDIKKSNKKFYDNFQKFNLIFTKLMSKMHQGKPILAYHEKLEEFPVSIEELNEGTSTGTLKSLILCYDIAYQEFAKLIDKTVPNFIVHDILENVEGDVLSDLVDEINSAGIQFIAAILKEKLDSSKINEKDQEKYTVLSLSDKDRVFEPKSKKKNKNGDSSLK